MNTLLINRSGVISASLFRSYSIKLLAPPLRNIVKDGVNKPIIYSLSSNVLQPLSRRYASYAPINIDPKTLTKDVIVFKYNNPTYFKLMNIFGIVQFFFWVICSEFTLSNLKNIPVNEGAPNFKDLPLYLKVNLGENKYKYGLSLACFLTGMAILAFVWTFTLRTVRFLVIRKGGNKVSFVTYGPFGKNRIMDVPLNCVSAVQARDVGVSALPLKVKNKRFHYLLDNRGEYTNPQLFDHVINVKRRF